VNKTVITLQDSGDEIYVFKKHFYYVREILPVPVGHLFSLLKLLGRRLVVQHFLGTAMVIIMNKVALTWHI